MKETYDIRNYLHLFFRAGFGISYRDAFSATQKGISAAVNELFKNAGTFTDLSVSLEGLPDKKEIRKMKNLSAEEKKKLFKQVMEVQKTLNITWIEKLVTDKAQLREKMTLFWHGHFACRSENPLFAIELNNVERKYAFGKFRDLLIAVSQTPAMLAFLNNQQNRKAHPNENFARELMELFTIGRGNYTEQDIKESARAFTGWAFDRATNEFDFKENQHDDGEKTFMGKTGNFKGEDIIDIILQRKETAYFICKKVYRFFVNDDPDEKNVSELSDYFYSNNYDIEKLMRKIFTAGWFYDEKNIGKKIKSPVEFIVMMNKMFDVKYEDPDKLVLLQRGLGQVLFNPPNVAGWSGGKNWIDSSTLMLRLKVPSVALNSGVIEFEAKDDMPEEFKMQMMAEENKIKDKVQKQFKTSADMDKFISNLPPDITRDELVNYILRTPLGAERNKMFDDIPKDKMKEMIIELVSLPEYQMI